MTARKKGKAKEAEGALDPKAIGAQDTGGAPVRRVVMSDIPERKSAEEALRGERFKAMVENAFEGTAIISKEGVTLYESATVERITGLTVDEAIGTNFFDKVHSDDMDQVVQNMARLVSKPGSKVSSICRIKLPDGLYHYIEYISTNLIDNPSVGGIVVNFRDITERKRAEDALRESEEGFRAIIENAPFGYYRVGKNGLWQYVNPEWERMHSLSLEEVIGKPFEITQPEDSVEQARELVKRALAGEIIVGEFGRLTKDGNIESHNFNIQPIKHDKEIVAIEGFISDTTERKHAEEALRESEEHYRALYESSRDALMTLSSLSWQFTSGNRATIALFGARDEADFVSRNPLQYSPERQPDGRASDEKFKEMTKKAMREGSHFFEWTHRNLSGKEFPASVLLTRIEIKGQLLLQATVRNEIDRKRAEKMLQESEENFRRSLNDSPLGIRIITADGELLHANQAILDIYGYDSVEELKTTPRNKNHTPESYAEHQVRKEKRQRGEYVPPNYEISIIRKDGEIRHLEVFRKEVLWNGEPQFQVLHNDITERKRAEKLSCAQSDLAQGLNVTTGLDAALHQCLDAAIRLAEMDAGGIYLVDKTSGDLDLFVYDGLSPAYVASVTHYPADSASAQLVKAGQPIYTIYPELGVSVNDRRLREGLHAGAVIPVLHDKQVIACLNLASHTMDEVPVFMHHALATIAAQIGGAIERKRTEEALKRSTQLLRDTGAMAKVGGWEFSLATQEQIWTEEVYRIHEVDMTYKPTVSKGIDFYTPTSRPIIERAVQRAIEHDEPFDMELEIITAKGNLRWVHAIGKTDQEHGRVSGTFQDITNRKRAEEALLTSLEEKEILLREVHHRVKNNLAAIIALMEMQRKTLVEPAMTTALSDLENRIKSMALVHERLYRSHDLSQIDFQDYLSALVSHLRTSMHTPRDLRWSVNAKGIMFDLNTAVPVGMIVNELVTNALKYAFPDDRPRRGADQCEITISLEYKDTAYTLIVDDNGVGLPPESLGLTATSTLGLRLVKMLGTHQLGGKLTLNRTHGTRIVLKFNAEQKG